MSTSAPPVRRPSPALLGHNGFAIATDGARQIIDALVGNAGAGCPVDPENRS